MRNSYRQFCSMFSSAASGCPWSSPASRARVSMVWRAPNQVDLRLRALRSRQPQLHQRGHVQRGDELLEVHLEVLRAMWAGPACASLSRSPRRSGGRLLVGRRRSLLVCARSGPESPAPSTELVAGVRRRVCRMVLRWRALHWRAAALPRFSRSRSSRRSSASTTSWRNSPSVLNRRRSVTTNSGFFSFSAIFFLFTRETQTALSFSKSRDRTLRLGI